MGIFLLVNLTASGTIENTSGTISIPFDAEVPLLKVTYTLQQMALPIVMETASLLFRLLKPICWVQIVMMQVE